METIFKYKLNNLINILLNDKKIIKNTDINKKLNKPSSEYKLKTYIDSIIKHYELAKELLKYCDSNEHLKYCICHNDNIFSHTCPICGNKIKFNGYNYTYTCRSKECLCKILLNNQEISDFHNFIKDNYLNGKKEFTFIQMGFIEKYGVLNNSQLKIWKEKSSNTWKNKTDEEREQKRNRTIETCRNKYGCDFSQQNEEIKNKQRLAWKNKTDEELQLKKERCKKTCLERYGVDHVMKSQEILLNTKKRNFELYGYYSPQQKNIQFKEIYFNDEKFIEYIKHLYKENNNERIKKIELDNFFNVNVLNRCRELNLLKYIRVQESELENKFKRLFDENNIIYDWRNRSIIDGTFGDSHKYELDFFIPKYNIGLEINDLSTHNFIVQNKRNSIHGKKYHQYKSLNCKEKNIRLIHLWEWEIQNNFNKISQWLINEFNYNKIKIFGRKCEIKKVDKIIEKDFLEKYHLQGYTKSVVAIGLFFENELIEIMTFGKPRFSNKYQYELLRLCTKYDYLIIGGTKKLFNYFIKTFNPNSIISYCDFSKFSGDIYEKIGMKFNKLSNPTITYCNYNWKTINESILMKYGIDNLLGTNYGKGTNNKELILQEGFFPVYNSGNLIYEWFNKN